MRLSRFDLNLFVVFDAIYRHRNLTRAAETLCVTQPAVSNALARLRRAFDDPLFVSTSQGMAPTPTAENIVGRVREALQLMDTSLHNGKDFDPATTKRVFRISMTDLAEALLLPALVDTLQHTAPGITLESYFTPRSEVLGALSSGNIDLAIDAPLLTDPQLRQMPLLQDQYVCLLREGHPAAAQPLDLEGYLALEHIHVSSRRSGAGHVDSALQRQGRLRSVRMRVQHYLVAPLIALRTDLALTAPRRLMERYPGHRVALPFELPPLELHVLWHAAAEQDCANAWLRRQLHAHAGRSAQDANNAAAPQAAGGIR